MFTTTVRHSDSYYLAVLKTLIRCLSAGFTDSQTATALNDLAILSPIGRPFTANTVTQILKKIRLHKEYPNKLHKALLQHCFDGNLNAADTLILFQPRRHQGGM
jgi:uncharacterized protein YciW